MSRRGGGCDRRAEREPMPGSPRAAPGKETWRSHEDAHAAAAPRPRRQTLPSRAPPAVAAAADAVAAAVDGGREAAARRRRRRRVGALPSRAHEVNGSHAEQLRQRNPPTRVRPSPAASTRRPLRFSKVVELRWQSQLIRLCDMATATNCDGLEEYAVLVGASKPFPVTWVSHSWSQLCGFDARAVRRTPWPKTTRRHPKTTRARAPVHLQHPLLARATAPSLAAGPRPRPQAPAGPGDVEGVDPTLMEGVRAGVPCSVELLNYDKSGAPAHRRSRAGARRRRSWSSSSARRRRRCASSAPPTTPTPRAAAASRRRPLRPRAPRRAARCRAAPPPTRPSPATSAPPTMRATTPSSLSSRTRSPRRGCPSSWRTRRSTSTSTPPRSPPSSNASPPQLSVPRALAPPDAGFCVSRARWRRSPSSGRARRGCRSAASAPTTSSAARSRSSRGPPPTSAPSSSSCPARAPAAVRQRPPRQLRKGQAPVRPQAADGGRPRRPRRARVPQGDVDRRPAPRPARRPAEDPRRPQAAVGRPTLRLPRGGVYTSDLIRTNICPTP